MKGDTIYHRHPQGFHVTVAGRYRGFLPKHLPGYCICCEERSNWPLCPGCHEFILEPSISAPTASIERPGSAVEL